MGTDRTRDRHLQPNLLARALAYLRSLFGGRRYRPEKAYMRGGRPRRDPQGSTDDTRSG